MAAELQFDPFAIKPLYLRVFRWYYARQAAPKTKFPLVLRVHPHRFRQVPPFQQDEGKYRRPY